MEGPPPAAHNEVPTVQIVGVLNADTRMRGVGPDRGCQAAAERIKQNCLRPDVDSLRICLLTGFL